MPKSLIRKNVKRSREEDGIGAVPEISGDTINQLYFNELLIIANNK